MTPFGAAFGFGDVVSCCFGFGDFLVDVFLRAKAVPVGLEALFHEKSNEGMVKIYKQSSELFVVWLQQKVWLY